MNRKIELLAPGGDFKSVKAALLAGADAVYLGVGEFNARKRAVNIRIGELEELCILAHQQGSRIYLTLNILALEEEFPLLLDLLVQTVEKGIDAVILQDYGLLHAVQKVFPELEIHASTQMTTHNRGQLKFLAKTGVSQVNFSRELCLDELRDLAFAAHHESLKVEVFVHGAFCVSFSGQCYMSGSLYQNSANRGACVQPCRREYVTDTSGKDYPVRPLNLKDNSVFSSAAELVAAGVDCLKIEGRIKGFEYVYTTVSAWKEQLYRLAAGKAQESADPRLSTVYNRSFSDNLLKGRLAADSFTRDTDDKSLVLLDRVAGYTASSHELSVESGTQLKTGQTISIKTEDGDFICTGLILEQRRPGVYLLRIDHRLLGKIRKGQHVWASTGETDFSAVEEQIESLRAEDEKLPLSFRLSGRYGEHLMLQAVCRENSTSVESEILLVKASERPLTLESVSRQLSRLGNTPFYLEKCDLSGLDEGLFIPVKALNDLRRSAVEKLTSPPVNCFAKGVLPVLSAAVLPVKRQLAVAVSSAEHLRQLPLDGSVLRLFQLPADPGLFAEAGQLLRDNPDVIPWFPSILIGEQYEGACRFLDESGFRRIVTDNTGIAFTAGEYRIPWVAGPMLNGSNGYALKQFLDRGAAGAFCSPELNTEQYSRITIPEGLEVWSALVEPVMLMKTRHCIVRNCNDCGKEIMDSTCLTGCSRSAAITDTQGNNILVVKTRGEYNSLYREGIRLNMERLQDPRTGTYLLDFRVQHRSLLPDCPVSDFIAYALEALRGNTEGEVGMRTGIGVIIRDEQDNPGLNRV